MNVVAVANQKGGDGKTTATMQLGAALSRRHRVLVVDVDPQQSTVWWADNAAAQLPPSTSPGSSIRRLSRESPGSTPNTTL